MTLKLCIEGYLALSAVVHLVWFCILVFHGEHHEATAQAPGALDQILTTLRR